MTLDGRDIEAGKGWLWPVREVIDHAGSWGDLQESHFELDGDEYWCNSDDGNDYAKVYDLEVAERIVALWNANVGVPTSELIARAVPRTG